MMKKLIYTIVGIADILTGLGAAFFFVFASLFIPGLNKTDFFSTTFLVSLAIPGLMVIIGILVILNAKTGPVPAIFGSFLVITNSLSALFSRDAPYFLAPEASPALLTITHHVVPSVAIGYFSLHIVMSFLAMRKLKENATVGK